jgi:lipopolysaccharide transport system permease protein
MQEVLVIEPGRRERRYWQDLWRYRELFQVLAWRDLSVRYKQTAIGALWALVRLSHAAGFHDHLWTNRQIAVRGCRALRADGVRRHVAVDLLLDRSCRGLQQSGGSCVPTVTVVVAFADFLISFATPIALMAWFQFVPGWQMLLLPLFVVFGFLTSIGPAMWITSLNVKYRDFRYIIPFIVQFGMYISPVGFSSSVVPQKWRLLYSLNPMVGVIDGFRLARREPASSCGSACAGSEPQNAALPT